MILMFADYGKCGNVLSNISAVRPNCPRTWTGWKWDGCPPTTNSCWAARTCRWTPTTNGCTSSWNLKRVGIRYVHKLSLRWVKINRERNKFISRCRDTKSEIWMCIFFFFILRFRFCAFLFLTNSSDFKQELHRSI